MTSLPKHRVLSMKRYLAVRRMDTKTARKLRAETFCEKCSGLLSRNNAYATIFLVEFNSTVTKSEQGVITAATNVVAGMEFGSALTNDDAAGVDGLSTVNFDTQKLRITITTISTT